MIRRIVLIFVVLLPGVIGVAIFGYFALIDWAQLQAAYRHYEVVSRNSASLVALTKAFNAQSIHRTNLFADGTWTLLSGILTGIGVHGLCVTHARDAGKR